MKKDRKRNKEQEKNIKINSIELIALLIELADEPQYKKKQPHSTFNIQEARFIRDIIFNKPKGLLFHYLADHLMNDTPLRQLPMFNAPSIKKLRFIHNFLGRPGNATKAAIAAGYSPRTAKQQAHRTLREIQGHKRQS